MEAKQEATPEFPCSWINKSGMIGIPYYLSFDGIGKYKPGRGEAGYTVAHVAPDEVASILMALPRASWMPGTYRIAEKCGALLGDQK